jgi:hypothetical protein
MKVKKYKTKVKMLVKDQKSLIQTPIKPLRDTSDKRVVNLNIKQSKGDVSPGRSNSAYGKVGRMPQNYRP